MQGKGTVCRICTSILRQIYVATQLNHGVHRVLLPSLTSPLPPPPPSNVRQLFFHQRHSDNFRNFQDKKNLPRPLYLPLWPGTVSDFQLNKTIKRIIVWHTHAYEWKRHLLRTVLVVPVPPVEWRCLVVNENSQNDRSLTLTPNYKAYFFFLVFL
jgi:hypothetical protein